MKVKKKMANVSQVLKAFEELGEAVSPSVPSDGLWGWKILIQSGSVKIDGSKLDVEFTVPFDDDLEANEAEIIVYNLAANTIKALKKNQAITITAGYKSDTGVIFKGKISNVSTKFDGVDKKATINALDSQGQKEKTIESITYKAGVKASYILKDLIKRLKLPIKVFKMRRDHTYKDAVTVSGGIMQAIQQYSDVCGVSTYICKGQVYSRYLKDGDNIKFTVSTDTGLIGSPEAFEEEINVDDTTEIINGYKFTMLLQHRITTASIISLKSRDVSGSFRVRGGTHKFDGSTFTTECEVI